MDGDIGEVHRGQGSNQLTSYISMARGSTICWNLFLESGIWNLEFHMLRK